MDIKLIAITALVVVGVVLGGVWRAKAEQGRDNPYTGLRNVALTTRPPAGVEGNPDLTAYGVVMDIAMGGGTATVTGFSTGDASLYLSTGGGVIGGIGHDPVRSAAAAFVASAQTYLPQMHPTTTYPEPVAGQTTFYVLTNKGIYTVSAPTDPMGGNSHALSPLFYAGQDVLTQLRLVSGKG